MAKTARNRVVVVAAVLAGTVGLQANGPQPSTNRVRTHDARIREALAEAASRSPTFRRLVETIDATDGIVYIENGRCGRAARSCLLHTLVIAGSFRVLNIRVDPRRPRQDLMVSLAHELRHATEVLSDPGIRTSASVALLYRRIGEPKRGDYETRAAVEAGLAVHDELVSRSR